eukprot:2566726-Rhodomonas_salina.1
MLRARGAVWAGGWLLAELAFYADKACTQRLFPLDPAASNVASVGAGLICPHIWLRCCRYGANA